MNDMVIKVSKENIGKRIDLFLVETLENQSRSAVQKLIENKNILVNKESTTKNYKLKYNDIIQIAIIQENPLNITPQNIQLNIAYQDDDLIVVNKPKGMVVHPAAGNNENTLVNALLYHFKNSLSSINGEIRPGIIHRIDKNTSGLLIVAKNDKSHLILANQIKEHTFLREYEAIVYGKVKKDNDTINLPIGRNKINRKKMCVTDINSKNAVTHYEVINRYNNFTHLKLRLETGRTHQIRVHMAHIGHPVAGDDVYGPKKAIKRLNGQCLHAKTIGFTHPITKKEIYLTSELPQYFIDFLTFIKKGIFNES